MTKASRFYQKTVRVADRGFSVRLLRFDNGDFVSITEGADSLGAMVVSLGTDPGPVTTTVIPAKTESLFLRLIAERISSHTRGIAIVSFSIRSEMDTATAKILMGDVLEMVRDV